MDKNLIKKVDQTIEAICKCIKDKTDHMANAGEISVMTNALAALITARANATTYETGIN